VPHTSNPNQKLIAELRDQLDKAQARIFQLEQLLHEQRGCLNEDIRLTPTQRKVVEILLRTNGICTKEDLYDTLYVSKQGRKPDPKILREFLRLIRRQLRPRGIEISFVFGKGYIISDEHKHKLNSMLKRLRETGGNHYKGIDLTPSQRKFVNLLLTSDGICTKEHLYSRLYVGGRNYKPDPRILREMLRVVRKRLRPQEIEIKTVFGTGYLMPRQSKDKLEKLTIK
jgi:Fe2+ or Zn2+ uptake regulation protein